MAAAAVSACQALAPNSLRASVGSSLVDQALEEVWFNRVTRKVKYGPGKSRSKYRSSNGAGWEEDLRTITCKNPSLGPDGSLTDLLIAVSSLATLGLANTLHGGQGCTGVQVTFTDEVPQAARMKIARRLQGEQVHTLRSICHIIDMPHGPNNEKLYISQTRLGEDGEGISGLEWVCSGTYFHFQVSLETN